MSQLGGWVCLTRVASVDGLTSQTCCQWMVRDCRERHSKKGGVWVSSWKQEEWKWTKDDLGAYSKHSRPQMKMILDFAIPVFRVRTHSDNEEKDRSSDRVGTCRGIKSCEIGWLLELENLESDSSNLEIYSVANRKQCNSERTGVMWQKRDFSVTTRASLFWTSCRRARFETDVPARRELQ